MSFRERGVEIKSPEQIETMRQAGLWSGARSSCCVTPRAPGVTTGELDAIAEDNIRSAGAVPSFKGYSHPPFPASICASVNDEVVHGIPGRPRAARRRHHLDRLRRHRRRLARRRRHHRRRRRDRRPTSPS